jgi:ethanolamine utilization protein EutK
MWPISRFGIDMNDDAYGFLEVRGLVTSIVAADAMVKTAQVRLMAKIENRPGLITLVISGDLGACSAAIDAGRTAAASIGQVVSEKVMGRPDLGLRIFFE